MASAITKSINLHWQMKKNKGCLLLEEIYRMSENFGEEEYILFYRAHSNDIYHRNELG